MKILFTLFHYLLLNTSYLFSQSVGIGTTNPNSDAQLDVSSTEKGILIPRLTSTQRNNIVRPTEGLMIYNTTTNNYNVFDGSSWKAMQKELPAGIQLITDTGQSTLGELGFTPMGNLYLGYRPPAVPLTIPDSSWYLLNQNDPDRVNTPALSGILIWIGTELLCLRTDSNFRFHFSNDKWTMHATTITGGSASDIGLLYGAVWTGTEVIWWNGNGGASSKVYRFHPQTNVISIQSAPLQGAVHRTSYSIVWTGTRIIVWGGENGTNLLNDGGIYNPQTNTWTYIQVPSVILSAIPGRFQHSAVWTGLDMIVWGGKISEVFICPGSGLQVKRYTNTGFRFNPNTLTFTLLSLTGAPEARGLHTAVWSGSEMIIYGGVRRICDSYFDQYLLETGSKYNPVLNAWTPTANHILTSNAQAFWVSDRMLLIGGNNQNDFDLYFPVTNSWSNLPPCPANTSQSFWIGDKLISHTQGGLYAFSTTPVTLTQAQPRRESKFTLWRKN